MQNKNKLAIFDLDGTLFDTKNVNYTAYNKAFEECGFSSRIDYQYYCDFCNGNSYKIFIPQIIPGITQEKLLKIHNKKKKFYVESLHLAVKNQQLFDLISLIKSEYLIVLVTTASRQNTTDILQHFDVETLFDDIITQEDVKNTKPSPEGFLLAMERAEVPKEKVLIFEDSTTGLEAAKASGVHYVQVYGYN